MAKANLRSFMINPPVVAAIMPEFGTLPNIRKLEIIPIAVKSLFKDRPFVGMVRPTDGTWSLLQHHFGKSVGGV